MTFWNKAKGFTATRLLALGGAVVVAASALAFAAPASAHGEKAQEAFLRMRTLHWYDVKWTKSVGNVNDVFEVTGKFRLYKDWPETVAKPTVAFLNIGVPGPSLVRVASYVNGVNMVNSTSFLLGRDYEFKVVLKGRKPGRYHVHTMLNVQEAGPLVGPGDWIEVKGDINDFRYDVTTLTGETVDLERYALGNVVMWHLIWAVPTVIWVLYWLFKGPLLLPRFRRVTELGDDADQMVSMADSRFGAILLIVTLLLTAGGYFWARSKWPRTIPLQTGQVALEPLPEPERQVLVKNEKTSYRIPGRSMEMRITVTNNATAPVQFGEFTTANVRWFNPAVAKPPADYSPEIVAKTGLTVDSPEPIQPGETRTLTIRATDPAWETWRLSKVIYDPDSRFGGLLFFYDADGNRYISEVGGPILPTFGGA
jgi:methane/ammonia monooxygenase subunit B